MIIYDRGFSDHPKENRIVAPGRNRFRITSNLSSTHPPKKRKKNYRVLTMAPTSLLPLEVLERIIDDVAEHYLINNLSSIKSCSLVCHSILPLCRKHIFNYVLLNDPEVWGRASSRTSDIFNGLLSNSPYLAVYIRNLAYHIKRKEYVAKRSSWLLLMLKKLVKLQKLTISYSPSVRDKMLSSSRKVLPLLHFPTLTSISLSSIRNSPLADLAS